MPLIFPQNTTSNFRKPGNSGYIFGVTGDDLVAIPEAFHIRGTKPLTNAALLQDYAKTTIDNFGWPKLVDGRYFLVV